MVFCRRDMVARGGVEATPWLILNTARKGIELSS